MRGSVTPSRLLKLRGKTPEGQGNLRTWEGARIDLLVRSGSTENALLLLSEKSPISSRRKATLKVDSAHIGEMQSKKKTRPVWRKGFTWLQNYGGNLAFEEGCPLGSRDCRQKAASFGDLDLKGEFSGVKMSRHVP